MFEAIGKLVAVLLGVGLLVIYTSLSWGYVTFTLYTWYVLPVFPDFPPLGVMSFVGLHLFINSFIRSGGVATIKDEYKDKINQWTMPIMAPWVTLLFAWVIKIVLF
jgi:hypothetical protein